MCLILEVYGILWPYKLCVIHNRTKIMRFQSMPHCQISVKADLWNKYNGITFCLYLDIFQGIRFKFHPRNPGVGLLNKLLSLLFSLHFRVIKTLDSSTNIKYRIPVYQVSMQLTSINSCQIWTWFTGSKRYFNSLRLSDAYMRQQTKPSLIQIMACRLTGAKPLSETMIEYCDLDHWE